jgi:spermidine synthase
MKIKNISHQIILFLLSVTVISNQISLIQYFAYQQWYNFASVVISFALFGFGVSGLIVPKLRKEIAEELNRVIQKILIACGFFIPLSILIEKYLIGAFDSYLVFFDVKETIKFFLVVFNYTIPFCLLATLIGLILTSFAEKIGTLYFLNLVGSGIGGILVVYLLWFIEPQKIYLLNGFIIAFLAFGIPLFNNLARKVTLLVINLILVSLNFSFLFISIENEPSQFKTLSRVKNFPDTEVVFNQPSPYGRVEIISSTLLRYSPGLSLNFVGEIPQGEAIFINAESAGFKITNPIQSNFNFLKKSTLAFPFVLKQPQKILILNSSGGVEINRAIVNNAKSIYVTEKNPILSKIISLQFEENKSNEIKVINEDPRIFVEKSNSNFDLIFHPVIEPVGYSSGLYSAQEKFLFTQEAFQKIYDDLDENGYFSISCYIDNPLKTFLKLLNTLKEIKKTDMTKISRNQILVINNWNVITITLKKGVFNLDEIERAENFASENQFDILVHPFKRSEIKFNSVIDSQTLDLIENVVSNKESKHYDYIFNVTQSTDDKPYFSNFIIPSKFKIYLDQISLRNLTYSEVGYFLVWLAFFVALVFSAILIFLAFYSIKLKSKNRRFIILIYFSSIGISFMFIELSLIQKFTLIFSSDVFAISFIISLLLISSGIGSFLSHKIFPSEKRSLFVFPIIGFVLITFLISSNYIVSLLIDLDGLRKYFIAGLIIFPLGFFIGMPFPFGIRKFCQDDENAIPFAWAINGSFSVLGSVGSILLLVNCGFNFTILLAAVLYLFLGFFIFLKDYLVKS